MSMHDNNVNILKALADKTRLDIVRNLVKKSGTMPSCDIVSSCSALSQPAMSHHFSKLVDAGVILEHKKGTEKTYELNNSLFDAMGINPAKL